MTHIRTHTGFHIITLIALLSAVSCRQSEERDALRNLDSTIAVREKYVTALSERIDRFRDSLSEASSAAVRYRWCDSLCTAYKNFDTDSLEHYLQEKKCCATLAGDRRLVVKSTLDLVHSHNMRNLEESVECFETLQREEVESLGLLKEYFYCGYSMYLFAASHSSSGRNREYRDRYHQLRSEYMAMDSTSLTYARMFTRMLREEGRSAEVPEILLPYWNNSGHNADDDAYICFHTARAYEDMGDTGKAILWYARSAEADFRRPVRQYLSLSRLAMLLGETEDYDRAYRYIQLSAKDAISSNYAPVFPDVTEYLLAVSRTVSGIEKSRSRSALLVAGLSILLVVVTVALLIYVLGLSRRLRRLNSSIKHINGELKSANAIRANYLVKYMVMCADYIKKIDENNSRLRSALKTGGAQAVTAELHKPQYADFAYKDFYREFDLTFLSAFPSFEREVNRIMQPQYRFNSSARDGMPMELRILAVNRIGITDYRDVAKFLNCALTTIYTYRTRTKRHSTLSPEDFDDYISKIEI